MSNLNCFPTEDVISSILPDEKWRDLDGEFFALLPQKDKGETFRRYSIERNFTNADDFETGLKHIQEAAKKSWPFIYQNQGNTLNEIYFQLQSRLMHQSKSNWLVGTYLQSLEAYISGSYLKAIGNSWIQSDKREILQIPLKQKVETFTVDLQNKKAAFEDGEVVNIFDISKSEQLGKCIGHNGKVTCLAFYSNGTRIVSGSRDKSIKIWDLETFKTIGDFPTGHVREITCLDVTPDGSTIVSGSSDRSIIIWNLNCGTINKKTVKFNYGNPYSLYISKDGKRIISRSKNGVLRVWTGQEKKVIRQTRFKQKMHLPLLALNGDGSRAVFPWRKNNLKAWDIKENKDYGELLGDNQEGITCLNISQDGKWVASGSHDKTIRVWNVESPTKEHCKLFGHSEVINSIFICPNGSHLLSESNDRTLRLWHIHGNKSRNDAEKFFEEVGSNSSMENIETESSGEDFSRHYGWISGLVFNNSNKILVTASTDATLNIWDVHTGEQQCTPLRGHESWVTCVTVSKDGSFIVSGSRDGSVRIWDSVSGNNLGDALIGHTDIVRCIIISLDCKWAITGSHDGTLRVWDIENRKEAGRPLRRHTNWVRCVALGAHETRIVSGSKDGTLIIWDKDRRIPIGDPIECVKHQSRCVALSENGEWLISGSYEESIIVWKITNDVPTYIVHIIFPSIIMDVAFETSNIVHVSLQIGSQEKFEISELLQVISKLSVALGIDFSYVCTDQKKDLDYPLLELYGRYVVEKKSGKVIGTLPTGRTSWKYVPQLGRLIIGTCSGDVLFIELKDRKDAK